MRKTKAAYRIKQRNITGEYTRPEIAFDKLFGNRVMKPLPIPTQKVEEEWKTATHILIRQVDWNLAPDRQFIGTNILVQIDGVYHRSRRQEGKTSWEDEELNKLGYRILHIDAELLIIKKHHAYVVAEVEKFLKGDKPTWRIAA